MEEYTDGFYNLHCPTETTPVLVYCYVNPDTQERGFGFNISDGGGFVPLSDLTNETRVTQVSIVKDEQERELLLRAKAEQLWKLLDDIDTAGDGFKPEITPYFKYVVAKAEERHKFLKSDEYNLFDL